MAANATSNHAHNPLNTGTTSPAAATKATETTHALVIGPVTYVEGLDKTPPQPLTEATRKPGFTLIVHVDVPPITACGVQLTDPPWAGDAATPGVIAAVKLAMTVQSAVTGAVVNVVPERLPPQVPPIGVTVKKPAFGVIVTVPVLLKPTTPPPVAVPLPPDTLGVTV